MYSIMVNQLTIIAKDEAQYLDFLKDLEEGTLEDRINWLLNINDRISGIEEKLDLVENLIKELGNSKTVKIINNQDTEEPTIKSKMRIGRVSLENLSTKNILNSFRKF